MGSNFTPNSTYNIDSRVDTSGSLMYCLFGGRLSPSMSSAGKALIGKVKAVSCRGKVERKIKINHVLIIIPSLTRDKSKKTCAFV